MSHNFTLVITEPRVTKAGKAAHNRHYSVQWSGGSYTLKNFCKQHGIGMPAMIARLRKLAGGKYEQTFMDIVKVMKSNRAIGRYANAGRKNVCPHCGEEFTRMACIYARRRKQRDASPADSVLRSMPAEFFGEDTMGTPVTLPVATPEA